jgi:osmoprotectant transport system ATP-binding protein
MGAWHGCAVGPIIAFDRVTKRYGEGFAVREVSLSIPERAFVAVVGGSGSGKTTLLKCVNRLIEPDAGEVRVEGGLARDGDPVQLRRRIGYVFQGIGLFPHMSVAENIAVTPRLLGWPAAEVAARIVELLELVALPQAYAARAPSALSGGERQRVGVARALAARPRIVLMDEPFGALDPLTRDALGRAYRSLHDRLGLTTLMVTHDVQEAVLLADRIVVMGAGRVLADDTPRALLASGDPEVAALMETPRRQAERVQALLAREDPAGG